MNEPYCKLACSILDSSIWSADDSTRIIWVTMLAMKGADGVVRASVSGLARRARKSIEDTQKAIEIFIAPDPDSKNQDNAGRKIERIDGGWMVLNHEFYRNIFSQQETRDYERTRKADYRAKVSRTVPDSPGQSGNVPNVPQSDQIRSDQIKKSTAAEPRARQVFKVPPREEVEMLFEKAAGPRSEADKFWNHYCSNGWKVGKSRMVSLPHAVGGWLARWRERQFEHNGKPQEPAKKCQFDRDFERTIKASERASKEIAEKLEKL